MGVVVESECCKKEDGPLLPQALYQRFHRVLRTSTTLKEARYE